MNPSVKENPLLGRLMLAYFYLSTLVLGVTVICALHVPVIWVSRLIKPLTSRPLRFFEWTASRSVGFLIWIQPWNNSSIQLQVPSDRKPLLYIANHRSHLDVFFILTRIPGVRILAKRSLFFLPILGQAMWALNHIPVSRGRTDRYLKAMKTIGRGIQNRDSILVFPEMTRCEFGQVNLGEFHLQPFSVARNENAWIVPIVIWGTDYVWPKGFARMRFPRFPVQLQNLEPIDSRNFESATALRQAVHERMQTRLRELSNAS